MTNQVSNPTSLSTQVFNAQFEDKHHLTAFFWRGRWCWLAKQVAQILGYSQEGRVFIRMIGAEWSEDFITGTDYEVIKHNDIKELKELVTQYLTSSKDVSGLISPYASSLAILYESGLHMALLKTGMPIGKRLRRWLVTEVLPQIARTGSYQNSSSVRNQDPPTDPKPKEPNPKQGFLTPEELSSKTPLFNDPPPKVQVEKFLDGFVRVQNIYMRVRALKNTTPTAEEQLRAIQILTWPVVCALAEEQWYRNQF